MVKLMVIPHPLGRTGFNDVRHAVLVVQRQDTNKPLELWECEWQDWRTNNIPAHFGLLPYLVYMLWLCILYALSSGYLFLAAAYPWIIPMFDSFNFKAKSQGGHLMPVVVGWCHHAVHARSMAGKYLRFLKRVTDSTAGKSGKSVRKVFPLLTWIFSDFGVEHPTTLREIMWWNHERKGFSTPLAKQLEVANPNGLENAFFQEMLWENKPSQNSTTNHFLGVEKLFQMRSILKNFSMRCLQDEYHPEDSQFGKTKTSEFGKGEFSWSNFMATTAFAMVFLANLALGGFPKSLTWNLSRLPIIQLPTCFFLSTAERVKHQIFHLEVCGSLTKNTYLTKHKLHWLKFGTTINKSKKLNPKNSKNGRVKLKSAVEL